MTYEDSTRPIIEHYDKQNLVRKVDASKTVDEVYIFCSTFFSTYYKKMLDYWKKKSMLLQLSLYI